MILKAENIMPVNIDTINTNKCTHLDTYWLYYNPFIILSYSRQNAGKQFLNL